LTLEGGRPRPWACTVSRLAARAGYDIVATFRETASGTRKKVTDLARARHVAVILVIELSRRLRFRWLQDAV
jgi:hypothetical protein